MISKVLKNNLCLGCGACESSFGKNKIELSMDDKGYLRPEQHEDLSNEERDLFGKICPGINAKHEDLQNYHPLWGPILSIKSGFSTDKTIRRVGSSGGVLTALASYLLEQKKVDCILQIGASKKQPYINEDKLSYTSKEVLSNAGSRYAPSATLINIRAIVDKHDSIAVIGKPCDIVGVRNIIKATPSLQNKIKFLLSFMCAGVPSQNATKKIIEKFNVKQDEVSSLKYRGDGWPGYFKIYDKSGATHKMSYNESWGTILNKELQFRCKVCADGTGEFADITCADAWKTTEKGYPSFQEREGESLIIARNSNGYNLLKQAISAGYVGISRENISTAEVSKMQPYQKLRKQNLLPRLAALKLFGKAVPRYNYKQLFVASTRENPLRLLKNFVGMIKRLSRA